MQLSTVFFYSLLSLAQAQTSRPTPTSDPASAGGSVVSQIYGFETTNLAALGTQPPSAISALATQIPPASILAMESSSSLLFASTTATAPPQQTSVVPSTTPNTDRSITTRNLIIAAVLGFVLSFTLVCFILWYVHRKRSQPVTTITTKSVENPYRDLEKNTPEPIIRSRGTESNPSGTTSRSHSTKATKPSQPTACIVEVQDDMLHLGTDGSFNELMKPVRAHRKHGSRGSRNLGDAGIDVNKPLPVPKLTLTRDARGKSFVDSDASTSPFASPLDSPLRQSPDADPKRQHRSQKSKSSARSAPTPKTQTPTPPSAAAKPALQRTRTAPAPARTAYTPSVYSERSKAETPQPTLQYDPTGRAPTRTPSLPLPRKSSKRDLLSTVLLDNAAPRARELRKDSTVSVDSEIKRAARRPSPLRVVSAEMRRSREMAAAAAAAAAAEEPLESPPWPPTRFSGRD